MVISQFNQHYTSIGSRFFFVKYRNTNSFGITKTSDGITSYEDRTHAFYSFYLELVK